MKNINVRNWHYRVICKLCRFHKPIGREPTKHDMQVLICPECKNYYAEEWTYGIYKLTSQSKWYNPFSWGRTRWLNKLVDKAA